MSEHQTAIDAIKRADSHGEFHAIVRGYSAAALARLTGANILDDTRREMLLLDKEVEAAITDRSILASDPIISGCGDGTV